MKYQLRSLPSISVAMVYVANVLFEKTSYSPVCVAVVAAVFPALRTKLVHGFLSLGKYWSSGDNSGKVTWSPHEGAGGGLEILLSE